MTKAMRVKRPFVGYLHVPACCVSHIVIDFCGLAEECVGDMGSLDYDGNGLPNRGYKPGLHIRARRVKAVRHDLLIAAR